MSDMTPSSNSETESRSKATVSYANLSNQEMFQILSEHGCEDLSSQINFNECSKFALNGGGYGDVHKGKLLDGTDIAIKVLRRTSNIDPKLIKRGMREVHRWSKVRHTNIHELMGVADFRGQLGMVSLWMEYGDLRSFIHKNPEVDRYPWCIQVAAGVSYLHTNEMIHGDLKAVCISVSYLSLISLIPYFVVSQSNVLLSNDLTVRISDFDCSIMSDCSLLFSATGQTPTSLRWAAPELMGSSEDEDSTDKTPQSDVYALGMTFLEIVTGKSPYSEYPRDFGVLSALAQGKYPKRPIALSEDKRKDAFWDLLVQCWNHNRTARPSAQRVLTRLQIEGDPPEFKNMEPVGRHMSLQDMFEWLLRLGCVDISSQMDPAQYSPHPVVGGGSADVWKGRLRDGTNVAIKALRTFNIGSYDHKTLKRAAREIYSWSRLIHPNIHRLMGVIIFRGHQLGMISQWTENGNLSHYIQRHPHFNRYQTCIQVASGLAYMHHNGVVHGDLRCTNVLVSPDGVAQLGGFSSSIFSGASLVFSETTRDWSRGLRWAAPELLEEEATKDKSADMYALGMTMLEIFSGTIPYPKLNQSAVPWEIIEGGLPTRPVNQLGNDKRSNKTWELMLSCWDYDPDARPTASEVLESLNTISSLRA